MPSTVRASGRPGQPSTKPAPSPGGLPGLAGGAALSGTPCLVQLPQAWQAAIAAGELWHDARQWLPPATPSPDGSGVLDVDYGAGPSSTTATVQLVGKGQRPVTTVGQIERPNGQGSISYSATDAHHIAFVFTRTDGEQAQNEWDLYSFDRQAGRLTKVASNPVSNGQSMPGGWVRPVVTSSHLYWIEPSADPTGRYSSTGFGSRLMSYDYSTGRTTTVYTGLTMALVQYQKLILFTAVAPNAPARAPTSSAPPPETVLAARQDTGALVAAPAGLSAGADQATVMSTNGDLVVWDATDGSVRGWRAAWGRSVAILPGVVTEHWPGFADDRASIEDPHLTEHTLVWGAVQTYVLDLRSDTVVKLSTNHGSRDVSGSQLAFWEYTRDQPPAPGQQLEFPNTSSTWIDCHGCLGAPHTSRPRAALLACAGR